MDIKDKNIVNIDENNSTTKCNKESSKPKWQRQKEEWYSQLNITLKQLDIIIGLAILGLIIVAICICIDASRII